MEMTRLYTVEEFEALPEDADRRFELIDGEIVEKAYFSMLEGWVSANLVGQIGMFLMQHPGGRLVISVLCRVLSDNLNARMPNIAYFVDDSRPIVTRGAVPLMPELVIEIKTPDDSYKIMRGKAAFYLQNGTKLVWLVYPEKHLIEVCQVVGDIDFLGVDDLLTADDLLPGFAVPVHTLFPAQ